MELSLVQQLWWSIGVIVDDSSTITTLTNSGTITGTATGAEGYGVFLQASTLTTLTNTGTITGLIVTDTYWYQSRCYFWFNYFK